MIKSNCVVCGKPLEGVRKRATCEGRCTRERRNAQSRAWRAANKEKSLASAQKWKKKNREYYKEYSSSYDRRTRAQRINNIRKHRKTHYYRHREKLLDKYKRAYDTDKERQRKKARERAKTLTSWIKLSYPYAKWRRKWREFYGNKCAISGKCGRLEIHHVDRGFADILEEVKQKLGISSNLYEDVSDAQRSNILQLFSELSEQVRGIPLTKELHRKFHREYGHKATKENFESFKSCVRRK